MQQRATGAALVMRRPQLGSHLVVGAGGHKQSGRNGIAVDGGLGLQAGMGTTGVIPLKLPVRLVCQESNHQLPQVQKEVQEV